MSYLHRLTSHPVTATTIAIATVVSVAWWLGMDIDGVSMSHQPLLEQPWTALTSVFPHVNILHLLFNCYWVLLLGSCMERRYGRWRTVAWFALWSVGSSLSEFVFLDGGVGLSGAVYGMWAFFSVLRRRRYWLNGPIQEREDQVFVGWFFLCIVLTVTNVMAIGNIAHGMGAVFGGLSAMVVCANRKLWIAATATLLIVLIALATGLRPWVNFSSYYTWQLGSEALELLKNEQWPQAEAKYRLALTRNPEDAQHWAALGGVLTELDRPEEAGEAFDRAFVLSPTDTYVTRAVAWWRDFVARRAVESGNDELAAATYQQACILQPGNAQYRRGLANALYRLGRLTEAREAFEVLLQLDAGDEQAKARIEQMPK